MLFGKITIALILITQILVSKGSRLILNSTITKNNGSSTIYGNPNR